MTEETDGSALSLTELELDALTEIINIGTSRAARNLSRMIGEQIHLSVPHTELLSRMEAAAWLAQRETSGLVAIGQDFRGAFLGQALLIFPEARSLELVRIILDDALTLEEIVDLEQEALSEIGNVVLNGCLVVMANMLKQPLDMSLPRMMRGGSETILLIPDDSDPSSIVLFLTIDFAVQARNINGYIAMIMDIPSLTVIKLLIRGYLAGLEAEE